MVDFGSRGKKVSGFKAKFAKWVFQKFSKTKALPALGIATLACRAPKGVDCLPVTVESARDVSSISAGLAKQAWGENFMNLRSLRHGKRRRCCLSFRPDFHK